MQRQVPVHVFSVTLTAEKVNVLQMVQIYVILHNVWMDLV
jgi:type IV secretory pathway VirB3-like protein